LPEAISPGTVIFALSQQHRRGAQVLRSFFKDGFDRGEKATHIVDPEKTGRASEAARGSGYQCPAGDGHGQLELRPWREAYLRGDRFDQDAAVALIEEILQSGRSAGYALTRLVGHMEWALLDNQA